MSFHLFLGQNHVSITIIPTLLIENLGNNVTQLLNIKIVTYKPHILNPGLEFFFFFFIGELRFIMLAGPEELTHQSVSPEQRGYRIFIDRL